jgi:hypothetical protein
MRESAGYRHTTNAFITIGWLVSKKAVSFETAFLIEDIF